MNKNRGVIILGSSRGDGNTRRIAEYFKNKSGFDLISLKEMNIGHYDYEHNNKDDDFLPLIKEVVEKYDVLVFATPVYWYSMSGILKVFFDRLSDCLTIEKDTGRKLRGKKMAMISCAFSNELNESFSMPFRESASYLGMDYLGDVHTWVPNGDLPKEVLSKLDDFTQIF